MLLCFAGDENMCILSPDRDVDLCLPTPKPHFGDRTRGAPAEVAGACCTHGGWIS